MVDEVTGLPGMVHSCVGDVPGWDPVAKRVFITGDVLVHSNLSLCVAL